MSISHKEDREDHYLVESTLSPGRMSEAKKAGSPTGKGSEVTKRGTHLEKFQFTTTPFSIWSPRLPLDEKTPT